MEGRIRAIQEDQQLKELADAFREEAIDFLVLKGSALRRTIYPDPALRPVRDLDILVKTAQFKTARTLLKQTGYIRRHRYASHEVFRHAEDSKKYFPVELHWTLGGFPVSLSAAAIDELFLRAVKVESAGLSFPTLHPVDALNLAAMHMIKHCSVNRMIWIYDLALLVQKLSGPDDWKLLQKICREWGSRGAIEKAIKGAREWTGLSLPKEFEDFSHWPEAAEIEIRNTYRLLCGKIFELNYGQCRMKCTVPQFAICSYRKQRGNSEGILKTAHILFRILVPKKALMYSSSYRPPHSWLLPLSYVTMWLHWLEVLFKGLKRASRLSSAP